MKNKSIQIILACLFLFQSEIFSQKYFFRKFSIEEGLPQSSVYCMLQDSRGYIWMGTDGAGVARFDGNKFDAFNRSNGLSDNVVRSLLQDRKGNIWIGTDNGLNIYNGFTFENVGGEFPEGNAIMKLMEGSDGTIWAATNNAGLIGITNGDSITINKISKDDGLISNFIFDIYEDKENRLWAGMVGGVNIIEFENGASGKIKNIEKPDIEDNTGSVISVLSINQGNDGRMWFGSYGNGLFVASLSPDNKSYSVKPSKINKNFPDLIIWDILKKKNGELWLATDKNGVLKISDDNLSGVFDKESGLKSNQILNIMEDSEGNTWFASFGQGAMMYDDEKFISYNESDGIKGTQVLDLLFYNDVLYVASEEGLMKMEIRGNSIHRTSLYSDKNGLNSIGVNAIERFKDNQIWIGTNNGINILKDSKIESFRGNKMLGNTSISCLLADSRGNVWIGTSGGYGKVKGDEVYFLSQDQGLINDEIQTIIEDRMGRIWMGTLGGLVRLVDTTYTDFNAEEGLETLKIYSLAEDIKGNIWIGTFGGGIYKFDITRDSLPISVVATRGELSSNTINSLKFVSDTLLVAGNDKGFDLIILDNAQKIRRVFQYNINDGFLGGENNPNAITTDSKGLIWFGTKNGMVRFDPTVDFGYSYKPTTLITGIKLFFEAVDWKKRGIKVAGWSGLPENLVLSHSDNHLTFGFTGFSYHNPDELEFTYFLEKQSKEWSPFSSNREIQFSGLTPGSYVLKVKARNKYGITGDPCEYSFTIKPPFWQTPWFIIPSSVVFIVVIILIMRVRERNLIKEKIKLEKIVEERTREVVEQKDEIAKQRDIVTYQKKEITDSIHYAERIQRAVLPEDSILKSTFKDYFVLFRPKDIVSGDFYWMSLKNDHLVFTAADCTGHGVPGAFMSMIGVSFLNKIVNESGIVQPSEVLQLLRKNIITALKQEGAVETSKDGMDIALCSVNIKKNKLWYAGANNPLFLVRKGADGYELIEQKADKMPIGIHARMDDFTNHETDLKDGDTFYVFSDGFLDQFGGPEGRKFMKPRFRQMLLDNQNLDMASQREVFNKTLEEWINTPVTNQSGNDIQQYVQVDDIILIGVRV
jgi:ligand-binding sensor domain-containing protein/serine phosphatase RsbU (regulator of sigma subunit)